jgi:hypothetical protein
MTIVVVVFNELGSLKFFVIASAAKQSHAMESTGLEIASSLCSSQ